MSEPLTHGDMRCATCGYRVPLELGELAGYIAGAHPWPLHCGEQMVWDPAWKVREQLRKR